MPGPIIRWLHRHDPEWYALHKAIKVAFAVTGGLAIGTLVIGNAQLSLFASFGGVALLLFADFPGGKSARFGAYVGLAVVGAVLITVGTLVSRQAWLAVLGMAVVGFIVLFAGVFSAAAAGATRAALLAYILPATIPATAAELPARLAGWGVAVALAVPVAILVWPPSDHNKLRARAADACSALAHQLSIRVATTASPGTPGPAGSDAHETGATETEQAITALRRQFRSTTFRPVGLTTGSRVLMQLTDRLEWLRAVADRIPMGTADRWPPMAVDLVHSCASTLEASAEVLAAAAHHPTFDTRQRLSAALRELDQHRAKVSAFVQIIAAGAPDADPPAAGPEAPGFTAIGRSPTAGHGPAEPSDRGIMRPSVAHELAYTTQLAGHTVAVSAAADARPLVDRLLGRKVPGSIDGAFTAAQRIALGHITRRSVWFQNSVRGALGLSIAVFLAEITQIAHGFWVVLGAMSVLRTTALTTGSTALRALSGTLVGFVAGAGILLLVGTTAWHLWLLLPFVVLVAAYLPEAVSFVAGQAAFTVLVVILFNIIQPVGWTVGLVRIEDIGLGCAAGLISGILLWPHGAAAQIHAALAETYQRSADALEVATARIAGRPLAGRGTLDEVMMSARAAGLRLDDALREYLFERGTKAVPVAELTAASNGASRVRLAAEAIAVMSNPVRPDGTSGPTVSPDHPPDPAPAAPSSGPLSTAASAVSQSAAPAAGWFREISVVLAEQGAGGTLPAETPITAETAVIDAFRRHPDSLQNPNVAARGRSLWSASLYIDDVTRLQVRLGTYIDTLTRPGTPGAPSAEDPAAAAARVPTAGSPG